MTDRLDNLIREGRNEMVEALKGLLAIPSCKGEPQPDAPFGIHTRHALDYLLSLGEGMGFYVRNIDGMAGYVEFGSGARMVAALGHLDVVPPGEGWSADPFVPTVNADGQVIARGAVDDKGPVIACLYAMKAMRDAGWKLPARVRLIVGLDEESGSTCMARYTRTEELPAAGFTPDADFPAIYAEKGILHLSFRYRAENAVSIRMHGGDRANVVPSRCVLRMDDAEGMMKEETFAGVPAHGSTPEQGDNAIAHAMAAAGARMAAMGIRHPFVEFFNKKIGFETTGKAIGIACHDTPSGSLTFNAGVVDLEDGRGDLTIDIRYPVTFDREKLLEKLRAAAEPFGITLTVLQTQHPLYLDPESPMIRTLTTIYQEITGRDEQPIAIGGGTYARSMPNVVAYGPGIDGEPEMAHKADEYITIDRMETCARIYARAFIALADQVAAPSGEGHP